jgi:hypothetical protein
MDDVISKLPCIPFADLNYCSEFGIMYQRDMHVSIPYEEEYFQHYVELEDSEVAKKLNEARTSLTEKYCKCVLDIGIGSGEFIKKSKIKMYGYDVNPLGIKWLKEAMLFVDPYEAIPDDVDGVTFWDTLEHIAEPSKILTRFKVGTHVFVSMPIFHDLTKARFSKHYKPNEHYYYYTAEGLTYLFELFGYKLLEMSDGEMKAGRQDILAFAFIRESA